MTTVPPPPPLSPPPVPAPKPLSATGNRGQLFGPRMIALLAIMISAIMGIVAATSLRIAVDARQQAAEARAQIESELASDPISDPTETGPAESDNYPPIVSGTSAPPSDPLGPQETPTPPDVLNPQAVYEPWYSGEVLNPQATSSDEAQIDLDEPRVGADYNRADIELRANSYGSDVPVFSLPEDDQAAAEASSPDLTPEDCADLIRTSPIPGDAQVPAQRGTILCVTTSPSRAAAEGINQRIVVVRVTALSEDGRATLEVSAWQVPQ